MTVAGKGTMNSHCMPGSSAIQSVLHNFKTDSVVSVSGFHLMKGPLRAVHLNIFLHLMAVHSTIS